MKASFSVFFLFLLVKICRSRDILPVQIPAEWKKCPTQKPISNQKSININNKKLINPLGTRVVPCHTLPKNTHNVKPVVSPKLHTHIDPDNSILPKYKKKPLNQAEIIQPQDISKESKCETDDSRIDKVLEIDKIENTLHNTIPKVTAKGNSEQHDNSNKRNQTSNDNNSESEITKQIRNLEIPRTDSNKTIPGNNSKILNTICKHDQMNKKNNTKESLKCLKILISNSKNNSGMDVNNARGYDHDTNWKSDIEIVINHDTNDDTDDPDATIIIHNEDYREFISGDNNKVQDFSYKNGKVPICNVQEMLPYDYGRFTRNQYTKSLSDEGNYANIYQLGTNTKQDNKYTFYDFTQNRAFILPNVINSNVRKTINDNSNANNIWRSIKSTYVIIRNNKKNIKLFLNYGRPGNKKFNQRSFINSHSDYRIRNNFKPYYPRYVYN